MAVTRRTFSGMLAGALATPRLAFAQTKTNCAFYSGVGGQLTHYEVDFGAATLAKRAAVTLPGGIQYAWPHPGRRYLYVATSSGAVGIAPVAGYPPNQHYLAAFRVTPSRHSSTVIPNRVAAMFMARSSEVIGEEPGLQSVATAIGTPARRSASTGGFCFSLRK